MVRVIDLDENGLTTQQVLDCIQAADGAVLRREGRVIARIQPADEIDLEDELWSRAPEQIARGQAARERFEKGGSLPHEQVMKGISE